MITEAYPLQWPTGWSRTKSPQRSRFGRDDYPSIGKATNKIVYEMKLFGGKNLIVSTMLRLRKDGLPYSSQRQPEDRGVAVYFTWDDEQRVIACDSFDKIGCNLWAIAKTIEAMRGINRWGCSEIISKAFTGFTALPEKASNSRGNWWNVLGYNEEPKEISGVKDVYRMLIKKYHPDNPMFGNEEMFLKIQEAYKEFQSIYA